VLSEVVTLINCGVNSGRVTACRSPKFLVISIAPCSLNHPRSHRPRYAFASLALNPSNTLTQSCTSVTIAATPAADCARASWSTRYAHALASGAEP
jgi:hypothetical protein